MAKWASADPKGVRGGGNLYAYANGSPLSFIDKKGTQPERLTQQHIDRMDLSNWPSEQELAATQLGRTVAHVDRLARRYSFLNSTSILALLQTDISDDDADFGRRLGEGLQFISLLQSGLIVLDESLGRYRANLRITPEFQSVWQDDWLRTRFTVAFNDEAQDLDDEEAISYLIIAATAIFATLSLAGRGLSE